MSVEPVGARQTIQLFDPAEEVIRRHVERIRQAAQVVEGRLSRSRFKMRDRGRRYCLYNGSQISDLHGFIEDHGVKSQRRIDDSPCFARFYRGRGKLPESPAGQR